ncbi:zinc finger protein 174-like [Hypanus sabinus]|uniref:zinc finger protein 174-like n=1 Tax=Hypanus sabinus TaxID=79690 RepID=UPI0028C3EB80|nr:zinc finger protein 174-like [Hypanus sabinus]
MVQSQKPKVAPERDGVQCLRGGGGIRRNQQDVTTKERIKNEKKFVFRNLKDNTPVLLSLSRYLRSGARYSINRPSSSDCGEGFTWSFEHLASPSFYRGERPFTCSDSGNGFTRLSQLKVYQQVHNGQGHSPVLCLRKDSVGQPTCGHTSQITLSRVWSSAEFQGSDSLGHLT